MRRYAQFCGVAKALDVLGERWTLLLVRDLLLGPRRYSDLLASHPGLTTNLLAARLKQLVEHGLIEQRRLPAPAASTVYALTSAGEELEEVVLALGRFGQRYLTRPSADDRADVRWFAVSMRRRFRSSAAPFRLQLHHDGVPIHVHWDGQRLHTRDGVEPADAALRGSHLPSILLGFLPPTSAELTGDPSVLDTLIAGLRA